MPRHHTISYPAKWIDPLMIDGEVVANGRVQAGYQVDVPFTAEEETARDAEERLQGLATTQRNNANAHLASLHAKLSDDTISANQLREMLRLERWGS